MMGSSQFIGGVENAVLLHVDILTLAEEVLIYPLKLFCRNI
jgi:hypothetical protein